MTEQTFSVGRRPRVVLQRVNGNLTVRPWREQSIRVSMEGNEGAEGTATQLYQEGDTVFISDCGSNLELFVPYVKSFFGRTSLTTDINGTDLNGTVTMESVGSVELTNVGGAIELTRVEGSLRATNAPSLRERKGIGGDAVLSDISLIEIGVVGGSTSLLRSETASVGAVGGGLRADQITALLRCGAIGGSCSIENSASAEVLVNNVGGSLRLNGMARMSSCNVGGSVNMLADLPANSNVRLLAGGSATITLPENANVSLHIIAGGRITGDAIGSTKYGSIANIVFGTGAATFHLTAGGSVTLLRGSMSGGNNVSNAEPASSPSSSPAQRREAILQMVAEGRITAEEGNMLLDALGEA